MSNNSFILTSIKICGEDGINMKIGRRLMILGAFAVALLCLSQVVFAYPVQGSIVGRVMQRGREKRRRVQEKLDIKERGSSFN